MKKSGGLLIWYWPVRQGGVALVECLGKVWSRHAVPVLGHVSVPVTACHVDVMEKMMSCNASRGRV